MSRTWATLKPYAVLIGISYGTRGLQMCANAWLARSYGAAVYTEYQSCQQIVLSLFFYFSLGITYVFSRQRLPPAHVRHVLLTIYVTAAGCGAIASVLVVTPIFQGHAMVSAVAIAAAYMLYSAYGLLNASLFRQQLFRRVALSGLLSPVALFALAAVPLATTSAGALLALVALGAPLLALVSVRRAPGLLAPFQTEAHRSPAGFSRRGTQVLKHYMVYGLALAAPVAVHGCIYSSFLAVAAYRSQADAESLAMLLPIFSLLMIAPQSVINLVLFKRTVDSAALLLGCVALFGAFILLFAEPLVDAVRWFMGYQRPVTLDPYWFVGFCVLMVAAKMATAIGIRKRQKPGVYVTLLSLSCLGLLATSLALYASGKVPLAPAMFVASLGALVPCLLPIGDARGVRRE